METTLAFLVIRDGGDSRDVFPNMVLTRQYCWNFSLVKCVHFVVAVTMKTFIYFLFLAGSHMFIKVLKTTENSPAESKGEILHSSLDQLDEFTVCGRFLTSVFSTKHHVWQNLIFRDQTYFLAAITLGDINISTFRHFYKMIFQDIL